ncbi:MAG: hypothetical protein JSW66_02655 [Phycisphaerales bacterium]|nr:MAG: hypothetical protein JSW66_02655 [Phycisphaerales bacterium]
MSPEEAFGVFLILLGCAGPVVIVGVVYYLKKRLEHKQIMAAIEKGTPLSELRPPKPNGALWIKNLTIGIALLIIGLGWSLMVPIGRGSQFIALILVGVGLAWIIRGLLNRRHQARESSALDRAASGTDSAT